MMLESTLGLGYGGESAFFGASAAVESRADRLLGDKPRLPVLALDTSLAGRSTSLPNRRPASGTPSADSPDTSAPAAQNSAVLPSVSAFLEESSGNSQGSASLNHSPRTKTCLYKTEVCCSWKKQGRCRYGSKCQFAHGADELRPVQRHPKYKTEICRSFAQTGECRYGRRCRFIHPNGPIGSSSEYALPGTANSLMTHGSGSLSSFSDPLPRSLHNGVSQSHNPALLSSYSDPIPPAMHSPGSCSSSLPHDSVQELRQKLSAYLPLSKPSSADTLAAQYQLLAPSQDPSALLMGAPSQHEHHAAALAMLQNGTALEPVGHSLNFPASYSSLTHPNLYNTDYSMTNPYPHMLSPLADSSALGLRGSSFDAHMGQIPPDMTQLSPELSQLSPELLCLLAANSTAVANTPAHTSMAPFAELGSQWLTPLDQGGTPQQLPGVGPNPQTVINQLAAVGCGSSLISHQVSDGLSGWDGQGYSSWAPSC